jgi:hypothetical protein
MYNNATAMPFQYCPLTSTSIACPANLCLLACGLSERHDISPFFLCTPPYNKSGVSCANAGEVLTMWCPWLVGYQNSQKTDPSCYNALFAPCMKRCSSQAITPDLLLPQTTNVLTMALADILSPTDAVFAIPFIEDQSVRTVLDGLNTSIYRSSNKTFTGFTVAPVSGYSVLAGIQITTAANCTACDPTVVIVESANAVDSTDFYIVSTFRLLSDFNDNETKTFVSSAYAEANRSATFTFTIAAMSDGQYINHVPHNIYRVRFPELRNATQADSMQVAGVQLLGMGCAVSDMNLTSAMHTSCQTGSNVLLGTTCEVHCVNPSEKSAMPAKRTCEGIYRSIRPGIPTQNASDRTNSSPRIFSVSETIGFETIASGQLNSRLFTLVLQRDCHLVLYRDQGGRNQYAFWASNTYHNLTGACINPKLNLTSDGAIIIQGARGVIWRSGPGGRTDGPFTVLIVGPKPTAALVNGSGFLVWSTALPVVTWTGVNPLCITTTTTTTTMTTTRTTTTSRSTTPTRTSTATTPTTIVIPSTTSSTTTPQTSASVTQAAISSSVTAIATGATITSLGPSIATTAPPPLPSSTTSSAGTPQPASTASLRSTLFVSSASVSATTTVTRVSQPTTAIAANSSAGVAQGSTHDADGGSMLPIFAGVVGAAVLFVALALLLLFVRHRKQQQGEAVVRATADLTMPSTQHVNPMFGHESSGEPGYASPDGDGAYSVPTFVDGRGFADYSAPNAIAHPHDYAAAYGTSRSPYAIAVQQGAGYEYATTDNMPPNGGSHSPAVAGAVPSHILQMYARPLPRSARAKAGTQIDDEQGELGYQDVNPLTFNAYASPAAIVSAHNPYFDPPSTSHSDSSPSRSVYQVPGPTATDGGEGGLSGSFYAIPLDFNTTKI